MSRALLDFNPEAHGVIGEQLLFGKPTPPTERAQAIDELEELDLASTFLEAQGHDALARLVDSLVRQAAHASRRRLPPATAAALASQLVRAAQTIRAALPRTDRPVLAAASVRGRAPSVDSIFGTELEGLSAEDQEFEAARRFVRFATVAVTNATLSNGTRAPPAVAASATQAAARRHAPGLLSAVSRPRIGFRQRRA
jgi:hypothetical protein